MLPTQMPLRSSRSAPTFDPARPTTIGNFFDDVEELLEHCGIRDATLSKRWACRYEPSEHTDRWKSVPEYSDASKTFPEFKAAIFAQYPGADGAKKYIREDLDLFVDQWRVKGVRSERDYAELYRGYSDITSALLQDKLMGENDTAFVLFRAFTESQAATIRDQLRLKNPDKRRGYAFPLADVHSAALWLFQDERTDPALVSCPSAAVTATIPSVPSFPASTPLPDAPIDSEMVVMTREDLYAFFEALAESQV
ncbi:hypothetical protein EUX98_g8185 [Antrodiella citrinella]|uniref:Uncharacterized protein n=1 Tax=Antrodiella citrinella TaxID=2447956 RepID=A0A4V3XGS2_9APHY|nr:hypothetical protein EUX98_g8185 [Antrodiella citrinella]